MKYFEQFQTLGHKGDKDISRYTLIRQMTHGNFACTSKQQSEFFVTRHREPI